MVVNMQLEISVSVILINDGGEMASVDGPGRRMSKPSPLVSRTNI